MSILDNLLNVMGGSKSVPSDIRPLIEKFKSGDERVQFEAYHKLQDRVGKGDRRVLVPLIGVLESGNNGARELAATLLGSLKDKRAVPPLVKALRDPWWSVRYGAIVALGDIGDRRAVEPIRKLAGRDPHERVGGRAALVLKEVFHQ